MGRIEKTMGERTQFGTWEKLELKGKGGQGEVFRARKITPPSQINPSGLADAVRECAAYKSVTDRQQAAERLDPPLSVRSRQKVRLESMRKLAL